MKSIFALLLGLTATALAQNITVTPRSVNVYSQGATTVYVTYGNLGAYQPAETAWCGEIQPAAPDLGFKCVNGTLYGTLPSRFDLARRSGRNGYTDIVSVPGAVARKAYQAAAAGEASEFYYVRRFRAAGAPDQFVVVQMRLSGNGAGVPFSLTDVQLSFGVGNGLRSSGNEAQVVFVQPDGKLPPVRAEIKYTGTGRLRGRWEVVRPGDELPSQRDLLPEASLPPEERGSQRRFAQLARFNVFLAPGGRFTLPGPEGTRIPRTTPGTYYLLLRVEASDDRENLVNLNDVNNGASIVQGGAAAGFALPVLRYVVGGGDNTDQAFKATQFTALLPREGVTLPGNQPIDFAWGEMPQAVFYRLEVEDANGVALLSAVVKSEVTRYRAPSFFKAQVGTRGLRYRVVALDAQGTPLSVSETRRFQVAP